MSTFKRLTEVFSSAKEVFFDDASKFVIFSDCHRGDNSWADDFAHNQGLVFFALEHYFKEGFTYIELGDGDELYENSRFEDIRRAHSHIFWLMREFHTERRLHLVFGNHDIVRKNPQVVERSLYHYLNDRTQEVEPLFDGIEVQEGIILRHKETGNRIFLVHGHQGDMINDSLWWVGRFFVRHLWRHLQVLGVRDPTSPAKNSKKSSVVENKIIRWIEANNQILICGHTHRPMFPRKGKLPYFNTGSCVHPRCITGIEIETGKIALIKWWVKPIDGVLRVAREELMEPEELKSFFPD